MEHINCPTCGAKTNPAILNCAYCGSTLAPNATLKPSDYIEALQRRLDNIRKDATIRKGDEDDERVRSIEMFTMPSEIQCLVEFFTFCDGNTGRSDADFGSDGSDLDKAWKGKARAAYNKLRVASLNNPQLSEFLSEFKSKYSTEAVAAYNEKKKREGNIIVIVAIILIVGACAAVQLSH